MNPNNTFQQPFQAQQQPQQPQQQQWAPQPVQQPQPQQTWAPQPMQQQPMQPMQQQQPGGFGPPMPQQGIQAPPAARVQADFQVTDQAFLESQVMYDAEIDANVSAPPVPPTERVFGNTDQGYTVFADFAQGWTAGVTPKQGTKYARCVLMLTIENCAARPDLNGKKIRYECSTLLYSSMPVSRAQSVIQAAGLGAQLKQAPKTQKTLMDMVTAIVNQKLRFQCTVDWTARFWSKELNRELCAEVRGWKNFPIDPQTQEPVPVISKVLLVNGQQVTESRNAQMSVRLITAKAGGGTGASAPAPTLSFQQPAPAPQALQGSGLGQLPAQPQGQYGAAPQFQQPQQAPVSAPAGGFAPQPQQAPQGAAPVPQAPQIWQS